MAPLDDDIADPLERAIAAYRDVAAYQALIKSVAGNATQQIRYYFKKPGHVRLEIVAPVPGAVVIYDPDARLAKLWPFGHGAIPAVTLDPDNPLIQSPTGQRVDRSDVGALHDNVRALQAHGALRIIGEETVSQTTATHIVVTARDDVALGAVCRYELWLDRRTGFPLKVESHDCSGSLIERVEMEDLQINPEFPHDFFSL